MKTEQATKTSNITYAQSMVLMKNMVRHDSFNPIDEVRCL